MSEGCADPFVIGVMTQHPVAPGMSVTSIGSGLTTGSLCYARISPIPSPQRDYRREDREIEHHVPRKRQLIAHVTKATATDINPARLCRDACTDEDEQEREQKRKSAGIQTPKDQRKPANHFQPGQKEREPHVQGPRKDVIILDIAGEANRVPCFQRARINEKRADDDRQYAPGESAKG